MKKHGYNVETSAEPPRKSYAGATRQPQGVEISEIVVTPTRKTYEECALGTMLPTVIPDSGRFCTIKILFCFYAHNAEKRLCKLVERGLLVHKPLDVVFCRLWRQNLSRSANIQLSRKEREFAQIRHSLAQQSPSSCPAFAQPFVQPSPSLRHTLKPTFAP